MALFATLSGFLGKDPETRQAGQTSVTSFSVAHSGKKDRDGNRSTTWVKCQVWGKSGETVAQHFQKGSGIVCSGPLELQTWQGRESEVTDLVMDVRDWAFPAAKRASDDGGRQRQPPKRDQRRDDYPTNDDGLPF